MSFLNNAVMYFMNKNRSAFTEKKTEEEMIARQTAEEHNPAPSLPKGIELTMVPFSHGTSELLHKEGNRQDLIAVYIHGGGFNSGTAKSRRSIALYPVKNWKMDCANLNYRLGPVHQFPAAEEDVLEQYEKLTQQYGGNIIVMGESAGGNLALSVPLMAKEHDLPMPKAVIAFSPVVQMDKTLDSYIQNRDSDPIVDAYKNEICDFYFVKKEDKFNPIAAPYHGDLSDYPPCVLVASDNETLLDDSKIFYEKLLENKRDCKLIVKHNMMHAFPMITAFPESRQVLKEIKEYLHL